MSRKATIALAGIAVGVLVFGAAANSAQAQWCYPAPVVVAPAPVYCPPPVYVAPAPVVYYPRPVYPVYRTYVPARPVYSRGFSFGFSYHR
ncbi:MAG TPA: hypothetical protein PL151_02740 [Phycisphaerae bacterium]|nr:hypothetical protein [Phycisphaerae bacterium]HOJ73693.1 hypothetical protein [Phycisphaerae bacterium]HOM50340.1 hypothetical protein [Phycisphaerae bacterium]HON67665.1 hypothetical protein [Phycisphaerae bacterium]HOQ84967.1 hypothetical protein [Phycisphaerae bacterium]